MNKQRERLIEILKPYMSNRSCRNSSSSCEPITCRLCRSRELAVVLLNSGVIVPPCKVGDTAYKVIRNNEPLGIAEYIVKGFHYGEFTDGLGHKRKSYLIVKYRTSCLLHHIPFDAIGETVFFNKDDAAAKLAETE